MPEDDPKIAPPLVVYFLGAGFSAPLGIPVVRTFIERARRLRDESTEARDHLGPFLRYLAELAALKHYMHSDLFDIEEALSIAELRRTLGQDGPVADPRDFIREVVERTMRPLPALGVSTLNDSDGVRANGTWWQGYLAFTEVLLDLGYLRLMSGELRTCRIPEREGTRYAVVSVNYDIVLELCASRLMHFADDPALAPFDSAPVEVSERVPLVKLHGSVDAPASIVPMTSSKIISPSGEPRWRVAIELLSRATEIRFIGYSLPEGDATIRYLVKAALPCVPT